MGKAVLPWLLGLAAIVILELFRIGGDVVDKFARA